MEGNRQRPTGWLDRRKTKEPEPRAVLSFYLSTYFVAARGFSVFCAST